MNCNPFVKGLAKICRIFGKLGYPEIGRHFMWYINPNNKYRLENLYKQKILGKDLIIFAGGGIIECSTNYGYYHHINLITYLADCYGIPVCFNGVGRVIEDKHKFGWGIMKRALNRDCVN